MSHTLVGDGRPEWLAASTILSQPGGLPDSPKGWRSYLDYLALLAAEDPVTRERKFEQLSRGWAIGSAAFQQELREKLERLLNGDSRFELLGAEPGAHQHARAGLWQEKLCAIAAATKIELQTLPATKSFPAKVFIAALMKKVTSVSNGWLATRLVMGGPSSVSSLVARFQRTGGTESPEFRALHSRFAS